MKNIRVTNRLSIAKSLKCKSDFAIDMTNYSVSSILPNLYENKDHLIEVKLSDKTEIIGADAFHSCQQLQKVEGKPKIICDRAFQFSQLSEFNFEDVSEIGKEAFQYTKLENIVFGKNLKTIKESAFSGCLRLREIDLSNVESIEHHAFSATGLLSVVMSPKLKRVGNQAFEGCVFLKNIVCLTPTPPRICESTFYGTNIQKIWVVNDECKKAFQTAKYWSEYADKIEVIDWVSVSKYTASLKENLQNQQDEIKRFCKISSLQK